VDVFGRDYSLSLLRSLDPACKPCVRIPSLFVKLEKTGQAGAFTIAALPIFNRPVQRQLVFKNVMIYRMAPPWTQALGQLEDRLASERFAPCSGSQEKSVGWMPPRGQEHGALVEVVAGQWLLKLMLELKVLPASVVKRRAEEEAAQIEARTGRKPGKKELRELRDDARMALLPLAFTKLSSVMVWIDPAAQLLVIDAGNQSRADEVVTSLVKAIDGLELRLLDTRSSPAAAMAQWLGGKEAPAHFTVDRECELKASDESRAVVRYTRHALDTDEVSQHIAMGKMPTRLAMTWNDRVSFVLTEALQLKKIALLDLVFEEAGALGSDRKDDDFDTDVALITGELSQLIEDLCEALGGEQDGFGAAPAAQAATA
jgi:recombination associated protein RdgC